MKRIIPVIIFIVFCLSACSLEEGDEMWAGLQSIN